jgi:stringent starvation protein B
MAMTSSRPYLVRALYEWILDNNCTPHLLVYADAGGVDVPRGHVQNGQIVLNIAPTAVVDLLMDHQAISFNARFNGLPTDIYIPMQAVMGIVTRENGQGMMFDFSEPPQPPEEAPESASSLKKPTGIKKAGSKSKPTLTVVK